MLSASPEKRQDLRRLYKLIGYLEDGESQGGGQVVENTTMKALEQVRRNSAGRVWLDFWLWFSLYLHVGVCKNCYCTFVSLCMFEELLRVGVSNVPRYS